MSIYEGHGVTLHHGDCLDVLRSLPDCSVDSVVTDPPYNLAFMGKAWDDHASAVGFQQWCELWAAECLRVLRPGGHLLAFGGTRTWHRLACAVEDAGFEVRDSIAWLYGSGFPKSLDVSKAIDKRANVNDETHRRIALVAEVIRTHREAKGMERAEVSRAVVGTPSGACWNWEHQQLPSAEMWPAIKRALDISDEFDGLIEGTRAQFIGAERAVIGKRTTGLGTGRGSVAYITDSENRNITAPATPDAERWQGWGTALKPAFEPVVVARKPLAGTVAQNVLTHGTGALNVDGCRVGDGGGTTKGNPPKGESNGIYGNGINGACEIVDLGKGRWPANVVLDESQAAELDRQSGESRDGVAVKRNRPEEGRSAYEASSYMITDRSREDHGYGGAGGASRFFPTFRYEAKAPKSERPRYKREGGSDNATTYGQMKKRECNVCGSRANSAGGKHSGKPWPTCGHGDWSWVEQQSARDEYVAHPTVKPLDLMRWLVRLVTPPGGTVLEPFAGSGTTVEACIVEGFQCIAIEREADYLPLIRQRIDRRRDPVEALRGQAADLGLFDLLGGEGA